MRIVIDETCPGCDWPEMGCQELLDGPAPVMTCDRCGAGYLTPRGAGLLLELIAAAKPGVSRGEELYRLEFLDAMIAGRTVAFLPDLRARVCQLEL